MSISNVPITKIAGRVWRREGGGAEDSSSPIQDAKITCNGVSVYSTIDGGYVITLPTLIPEGEKISISAIAEDMEEIKVEIMAPDSPIVDLDLYFYPVYQYG